ncbi:MAG TPA: hypothetical protein VNT51_01070, partial [Miltoncostaeaceae bacterium]|nr:hypothetical protein [Miltoncostaeaceae bacterium]
MALALVAVGLAGPAGASAAPRVTVFGDSVQASFGFAPQARRALGSGLRLRMEADVCRRLVGPGCLGGRPPSVLALAEALGPRLGPLVVVHVGYNDSAGAYDVERVLRAFRRAGVRAVVWVTLREARGGYRSTNVRIRDAARRVSGRRGYPLVRIAEWDAAGRGRPGWFTSDRIHLNASGALGLAGVLRTSVVRTLAEIDI